MAFYLIGEQLQPPTLRFDPSSIQSSHQNAKKGLIIFGPYDAQILGKENIGCVLIYPKELENQKKILEDGLIKGKDSFPGFQKLFRIPLVFLQERRINKEESNEIEWEINKVIADESPDLVIVMVKSRNDQIYRKVKSILLGNGIPSQIILANKLENSRGLPWIFENISLQVYAKIGGTPWTIVSPSREKELVIGVSRAMDKQKNFVIGFITLFTHDGDYQFLYSLSPKPVEGQQLDEYQNALAELIVNAYKEYEARFGSPSSLVIQFCKRPGKFNEIAAVEKAIKELGKYTPYALLHLNDDTSYRLFDSTHSTYVPTSGIKVELNPYSVLLLLDGRSSDQSGRDIRRRRGVPRMLEIYMDRRSTMASTELPRLVQQVYSFACVNYRGFNARAIPVTLNYSYLVARLVAEIGAENWNHIASAGALRNKAWFL